jgi:hypothetical protein
MTVDTRLVNKGKNEPRDGLAQQGKVHIELAKQHASALDDNGWSGADTDELAANVAKLEAAAGSQAAAYDHAGHSSTGESQAIDDAKAYLRRLRNALPRALREAPGLAVKAASFHAGETLGRSTPKISKHLAAIRPAVVTLDAALKTHFKGGSASDLLDKVKSALDKADTTQEAARTDAPGATLTLYEVMGKVVEQIEDLNRAGKSAFDGDAATRGKFNKDILLRARKQRAKKAEEAPEAGEAPKAT